MTAPAPPRGRFGPRRRHDPEEVNRRILEVCAHYAASPGRTAGRRTTWACPVCGKHKMEALPERGMAGCWTASCPVPQTTNALGLVAFFEGLDRRLEFPAVLERAAEVLGLGEPPSEPTRKRRVGAPPPRKVPPPDRERANRKRRPSPDPGLLDAAYGGLLAFCPLSGRDRSFWASRGVKPATAARGRFASATRPRIAAAVRHLLGEFGREGLLTVPGFFENARGEVSFTLLGDYQLVPYVDGHGRVTTIEGRATESQRRRMARAGIEAKYVSLRDSGSHLYLFPGLPFDGIEAFTEGSVGAIVAAQEGINVAAIKGVRCYRAPDGGPLPELAGADLSGRIAPFIPDADDPPNPDVLDAAPKASRALASSARARPAICYLPRGLDLDEWLLSLPEGARRPAFDGLLSRAARPGALRRGRPPPA